MQDSKRESPPSPSGQNGSAPRDGGERLQFDFSAFGEPAPRRRGRGLTMAIVGLAALAGIVTFVLHRGDVGAFASHLSEARPEWLLLAIAAQIGAFFLQALIWWFVLRTLQHPKHLLDLFMLSIGKLFADQALPSAGVSGAFFIMHALTRRNVPQEDAFIAFVFGATSFIAAFGVAVLASFAYIASVDGAPRVVAIGAAATYALVALLLVLLLLAGIVRFARLGRWLMRFKFFASIAALAGPALSRINEEKALFARCILLQLAARAFDGLTLWLVFFAIGQSAPIEACLIAVSIASLAATIAPTPMGVGTFETGMVAALSALGVSVEAGLTTTLLYRGLTLWLPLLIGFFIVQRELLRKKPDDDDESHMRRTLAENS